MRWFLFVLSILIFLAGMMVFVESKSVLHEMIASIVILGSIILFSAAAIVDAIVTQIDSAKIKNIELLSQIKDELRKLRLKKYPEKREDEK